MFIFEILMFDKICLHDLSKSNLLKFRRKENFK